MYDQILRDGVWFAQAVFNINEYCPFPCDQHWPLPAEAETAFRQQLTGKPEEAEDILGWAAHLVPDVMGWEWKRPQTPQTRA